MIALRRPWEELHAENERLREALERIAALPGKGLAGTGAAGWLLTLEAPEIAREALRGDAA